MLASRSQATFAALLTALAVAACGSAREQLIESGLPPPYADGYVDGCASGEEVGGGLFAGAQQDMSRYRTDDQYSRGWDEGFEECRRKMDIMVFEARQRRPSRDN